MSRKYLLPLIAGAVALALVAGAYLAIPLFVSTVSLKGEIEARVERATGRTFRINGPLTIALFPTLSVTARDVTLANAPGGKATNMVRIDTMRLAVKLWPLLHGKIEATEAVFDRPEISLEVDREGHGNWELVRRKAEESGIHLPTNTLFGGAEVHDARVSYDNAKLGLQRSIDDLDADVDITRLSEPVKAEGSLLFQGRRFTYHATVGTIRTLLSGAATRVDVAADSDLVHAGFVGFLSSDGTAKGNGSIVTPSMKNLAAWLGRPVEAGDGLGALTAIADIAAKDRRISLSRIKARLDGMSIGGSLVADVSKPVPDVTANLTIDRIDLNTYMHIEVARAGARPAAGPPSGGWSRAPVRLDLLKLANGHVNLAVGSLVVRHLKLGFTKVAATLTDGAMEAHLDPITLYGGRGRACLAADGHGDVPSFRNQLIFSAIAMRPFLADAIGVGQLDGTGTISLDVAATGASPDAIMRTMSGKGSVAIVHGRVTGVDMGQVARTVQTILSAGATGDSAATAFDSFSGSFAIQNGVMKNNDLKMSSAFINMTGHGTVDLGNQTLAYRIEPRASLGGRMDLLELGVPFTIYGTWAHVKYVPDMNGAVTGMFGAVIDKGLSPVTGLLGALTGSPPDGKPKPDKPTRPKGVADTIKGIFGLH
ncbi:MAG: AsmA family protein [Alphaproteobacteria bacterium]|nr:AsmA family protein [Alphaproteobacteria bacterium]MBL6939354.1 AsmA family protein [Alphaproteobacteria bacterium]MBL7097165.1 AsmA family protein [Alphaproteobacteria bacterium]